MDIKDELINIGKYEVKSGYHKARLIAAVGEKGLKILTLKGRFLKRYIKELKND